MGRFTMWKRFSLLMDRQNRPLIGAIMMVGGAMAFPVGDAAAKHLAELNYSTVYSLGRVLAVGGLLLWPFLWRAHKRGTESS